MSSVLCYRFIFMCTSCEMFTVYCMFLEKKVYILITGFFCSLKHVWPQSDNNLLLAFILQFHCYHSSVAYDGGLIFLGAMYGYVIFQQFWSLPLLYQHFCLFGQKAGGSLPDFAISIIFIVGYHSTIKVRFIITVNIKCQ